MELRELLRNLKLKNTMITLKVDVDNKVVYTGTIGTLLYWVNLEQYMNWYVDVIYCYDNHFVCELVED